MKFFILITLLTIVESALLYKDFSSTRNFKILGHARHNPVNKTMELISEGSYASKTHKVCSIWTKKQIYWQDGFEIKLVFRMRTPDSSNDGGEGFAINFQQDRPVAVGDLRSKGERPQVNGKTYYPSGIGFNELRKSWSIKFDMRPTTTDATRKVHVSVHTGGDWLKVHPQNAFTDELPTLNNNHNHVVKIYYDKEPSGGVLRMYWTSDFEGNHTWGTWNTPILEVPMTMPHLDERPAWFGFTSATGFDRVQTVDLMGLVYHEIRHINGNGDKCIVCGGINPRCCLHWEMLKEEKDSNLPRAGPRGFNVNYRGGPYQNLNKEPLVWNDPKAEWS